MCVELKLRVTSALIWLVLFLKFYFARTAAGYMVNNNPYNRLETLDSQGTYHLEWLVDWSKNWVTFNVTVKTKGYVELGLSPNGKIPGSDVVIGGVFPNGSWYFSDRHGAGDRQLELDASQDWKLHFAWENQSHSFLSFSRPIDTCNPQDYPITENRIALIWAYGEADHESGETEHTNRGVYNVHLLQPDYSPPPAPSQIILRNRSQAFDKSSEDLKLWSIPIRTRLSRQGTTYLCTIHKAPKLDRKHHVVGFDVVLPNEVSQRHIHHLIMYMCKSPPGYSAHSLFEPFVGYGGQQCLSLINPIGTMPTEYCGEVFQVWGVGGRSYFNPPHVGQAFGASSDEYYMAQVHYDNLDLIENLVVDLRLDIFYTDKLRSFEGGLLAVISPPPSLTPSILLPPNTRFHIIQAHCGPKCTEKLFKPEGINIHGAILHSHNSGRQIKLHHFRGDVELPWIAFDDNYAFDYQQFRVLTREHKILPGDQLTIRCVYDNTWMNGSSVVGGFSTSQEMCGSYVFYYNKINDYRYCGSLIVSEEKRQHFLGISNVTWSIPDLEYVVDLPEPFAGRTVSQVSDNYVTWNLRTREALQRFHMSHPQVNFCSKELHVVDAPPRSLPRDKDGNFQNPDNFSALVEYPFEAKPFEPTHICM